MTMVLNPDTECDQFLESLGNSPESMIGRKIEIPVSDLTGNFKKGNTKAIFRISECQGTKCNSDFVGHYVSDDYIRRMVRRRKERIDIVSEFLTNDNYVISVKSVIVTDAKLTANRRSALRKTVKDHLTSRLSQMSYHEACSYLIGDEIQNEVMATVKHIYPVKKLEIRKSEVVGKSRRVTAPENVDEASTVLHEYCILTMGSLGAPSIKEYSGFSTTPISSKSSIPVCIAASAPDLLVLVPVPIRAKSLAGMKSPPSK